MWSTIISYVSKYGSKAIKWAWDNKWKLLGLGQAVWEFIDSIWS